MIIILDLRLILSYLAILPHILGNGTLFYSSSFFKKLMYLSTNKYIIPYPYLR